jgi:hypothetical protein
MMKSDEEAGHPCHVTLPTARLYTFISVFIDAIHQQMSGQKTIIWRLKSAGRSLRRSIITIITTTTTTTTTTIIIIIIIIMIDVAIPGDRNVIKKKPRRF